MFSCFKIYHYSKNSNRLVCLRFKYLYLLEINLLQSHVTKFNKKLKRIIWELKQKAKFGNIIPFTFHIFAL